jgi:hypothetical protein
MRLSRLAVGALLVLVTGRGAGAADTKFTVDPEAGHNAFTAIFDSAVGERITAVSSAVGCTVSVDEEKLTGSAKCAVPLASIMVDNDKTKTEHFHQWATNKKIDPKKCRFELDLPHLTLEGPVDERKPVVFTTEGTFTICGRPRDDKGAEKIQGTITYVPAADGKPRTLRIRAHVDNFDRERYGVSPKATAGWLARVQQLADVVATQGSVDVSLFARDGKSQ